MAMLAFARNLCRCVCDLFVAARAGGTLNVLTPTSSRIVHPGDARLLHAPAQPGRGDHPVRRLQRHRPHDRASLDWPWMAKKKVSVRANNFISDKIKVNDLRGNPIEIAAQIVWRVVDTAQALFDVDDYKQFVGVQVEAAMRTIGSRYPYDDFEHQEVTLRGNHDQVGAELRNELQARLAVAGITVDECGFTHLAYAQEIAGAMLRRQQAQAVVAARKTLVEGAVGMVEMALEHAFGEERRRARRRAPRGDGLQPDGRAVRRPRHPAGGQHRHARTSRHAWAASARPIRCGSTRPCGRRSSAAPRPNCAASTPRSNACCARRCVRGVKLKAPARAARPAAEGERNGLSDGPEWFAPKRYGWARAADHLAGLGAVTRSSWRSRLAVGAGLRRTAVGVRRGMVPATVDLHPDRGQDDARRLALAVGRGDE